MIRILEHDGSELTVQSLNKISFDGLKWIDLANPTAEELQSVAEKVGISLRDLKASADPDERPRVDELEQYVSIIIKAPFLRTEKTAAGENREMTTSSLGFFISEKLLITVHEEESMAIAKMMAEHEKLDKTFEKGATALMTKILEEVIHEYLKILDEVEEKIDKIEDAVFENPEQKTVKRIFRLKKTLIYFHKALTANLDVLYKLEKDPPEKLNEEFLGPVRYVHDDLMQMVDMVATYRDLLTSTLDIYLSSVSNNMNAIMKRMTAWASLILIPTFITGLYGMNFTHMPEIDWPYGYLFSWGLIAGSVIVLAIYFKRKDWF